MEINPKQIYSNGGINLPKAKKGKAKKEEKSAEKKSKAPNNPSYYSNYYGIHKISFGQKLNTDKDRLDYLMQLKDPEGSPVFEKTDFEPDENGKESSLVTLSTGEREFEFFKTMAELKYDNGKNVLEKEGIKEIAGIASSMVKSGEEEFEMYGIKGKIKFSDDLPDFLYSFINEKDENGEYLFNSQNIVPTLLTMYMFKTEDVPAESIIKTFKNIHSMNQEDNEDNLSLSEVIELTIFKTCNKDWKDFDIRENLAEIKKYCRIQSSYGLSAISPAVAGNVIRAGGNTRKTFDRLITYKKNDNELFFSCDEMFKIADVFKDDEKVFERIDKLIQYKNQSGETLLHSSIISEAILNGETAYKNAIKICEEKDEEKQQAIIVMYDIKEIIKDNILFERAQKVFEQKGKDGHILCDPYTARKIINNEKQYNNFIKYARVFRDYSLPYLSDLINLTDKQLSQIAELMELTKKENDKSSYLLSYSLDLLVQDNESFEISKKLIKLKDKDNKPLLDGITINQIFEEGKEYAKRCLQAAELLQSTGIEFKNYQIKELAKDEKVLNLAELFRGVLKEDGKPILKYNDLITFAKCEPEKAQKIAQILKLKTTDGKHIEIPFHQFGSITKSNEKEFKNLIEYMPQLMDLKDQSGKKIFSNPVEIIECAKKGEKALKHAKTIIELKKPDGTQLFNNYNIAKAITLDDDAWKILIEATTGKNSTGENIFYEDSIILSTANSSDIKDRKLFLKKAKALSELRSPINKQKRLLSDEGIYLTAKQDKDFIPKYKEYAPKLYELKNHNGKEVINNKNIHRYILDNDMEVKDLCHYINTFENFKASDYPVIFSENNIISTINKGKSHCDEVINLLTEISNKKLPTGASYVTNSKLSQLLGQDIEQIKRFSKNIDKFDEFKDYPFENNICQIIDSLAELSEEDLEKALKLARCKDKNNNPFFTYTEIHNLSVNPAQYRHTDIGVLQTFDEETKDNLSNIINSVCTLKETMLSNPMLYVNGQFETPQDAAKTIEYFFSKNKGKLLLMTSIFDKETIDIIMRKRIAISSDLLNKLHDFDEKEQKLLKRLINSANTNGKPFLPTQKLQFINLLSAYKTYKVETDTIEEMLNEGKVDIGKAELTLLKNIIKGANLDDETIAKIPPEKIYAWNNEYLHLLITDMKSIPAIRDLFVATLTGDFNKYIQSPDNIYGQANENTKKQFEEAGLNYAAWLKPNESHAINYVSRDKNAETLVQITKQIEEDIETLRRTPAKKFIDKQLSKHIKEDKFSVPTTIQTNKNQLTTFVNNTIAQLNNIWERAAKNLENPDLQEKARNTLTILDHLNQRIQDIANTPETDLSKNLDLTIKMWERRPEKDIFQGNYSTCCIAIGNFNSKAMPHFVMNNSYNMIELTDNYTGKTIGNALCYFIKDQSGKPAFIIDNIEINNANKPSERIGIEIRNKMAEYASKVAKEVTGRDDTFIYMSNHYNDVSTSDLKSECQEIEFLGDTSADQIYMDLFGGWVNKSDFKSTQNLLRLK